MTINTKSVLISGFAAGIIIIIIGFGLVPILGNQMNEILAGFSLPPLSTGAMVYFTIISLINGISIVWIYALVQSKFKSKLKAALLVSVIFWFFTYFKANASLVAYGFMPLSFTAIGTAWGLLELVAACIIGSKLYKNK